MKHTNRNKNVKHAIQKMLKTGGFSMDRNERLQKAILARDGYLEDLIELCRYGRVTPEQLVRLEILNSEVELAR